MVIGPVMLLGAPRVTALLLCHVSIILLSAGPPFEVPVVIARVIILIFIAPLASQPRLLGRCWVVPIFLGSAAASGPGGRRRRSSL